MVGERTPGHRGRRRCRCSSVAAEESTEEHGPGTDAGHRLRRTSRPAIGGAGAPRRRTTAHAGPPAFHRNTAGIQSKSQLPGRPCKDAERLCPRHAPPARRSKAPRARGRKRGPARPRRGLKAEASSESKGQEHGLAVEGRLHPLGEATSSSRRKPTTGKGERGHAGPCSDTRASLKTNDGKFARTPPSTMTPPAGRASAAPTATWIRTARGIAADATTAEATEQFGVSM